MKKTLSLILTVIILLSSFSLQSFALLGFDKIEKVDIKSCEEFSLKEVREYIAEFEGEEMEEEDKEYPIACEADVTISTGEVISVKDMNFGYSENNKRIVDVYAWVNVDECIKAAEEGKNTVPLYVETYLYSSIDVELDKKIIESEASFVESYVKSLTLVEGEIKAYERKTDVEGGFYYSLLNCEGLVFDIEYGNGTKTRATLEEKKMTMAIISSYTLDGEYINIYADDEEGEVCAYVYFMDIEVKLPVTVVEYPIKELVIDEVTFDDKFNEKTLTLTVTKSDGTKETIDYEFGKYTDVSIGIGETVRMYDSIYIEGFLTIIGVHITESEDYPPTPYKEVIVIVDESMYVMSEKFEGPKAEDTLLGRILYKLRQFIVRILNLFF